MEFITHLPKTRAGYDSLLVMVDYVTKMMVLRPTHGTAIAVDIARIFVDEVVRLHGLSRAIVSDRDTKFTSSFWTEVRKVMGHHPSDVFRVSSLDIWADREGKPVHRRDAEGIRG